MQVLVIGDLHITKERKKAIEFSFASILNIIKDNIFSEIILLGDIFNKNPIPEERLMFADFLNKLYNFTNKIYIVKGTDSHDYFQGVYNLEDIVLLNSAFVGENSIIIDKQIKLNNFLFVHEPIKGAKYDNGIKEKQGLDLTTIKEKVIAGHYHTPQTQLGIVGSIYKTTFAQKDNSKQILIINEGKLNYIPINTRPMYELNLNGKQSKIKCKEIKSIDKKEELDLKINVITDIQTLPLIHTAINKIKKNLLIEYYQENMQVDRIKVDVPVNLSEQELLKIYCKKQNTDYALIEKSLYDKTN